jgi:hypothetical protein
MQLSPTVIVYLQLTSIALLDKFGGFVFESFTTGTRIF